MTRDVLCCKTLQEMGRIVASEGDETASWKPGTCGGRGGGQVWQGDGSMVAE